MTYLSYFAQFLLDYGLTWVGYDYDGPIDGKNVDIPAEPTEAYKKFAARVDELNNFIRAEPTNVRIEDGRRARLVHAEEAVGSIKITFYKNGLMIKRGPFRYAGTDSYTSIMRDILDGYFPSEFQPDHPDGVVIDLADKSHVEYKEGGVSADRMTGFQLIKRLPKHVVRNGEVIDVAESVAKLLNLPGAARPSTSSAAAPGSASPSVDVSSSLPSSSSLLLPVTSPSSKIPAVSKAVAIAEAAGAIRGSREAVYLRYNPDTLMANIQSPKEKGRVKSAGALPTDLFGIPSVAGELAKIQVKWGTSGQMFVVEVPRGSVVRDIRNILSDYQFYTEEAQKQGFELRTSFPPRLLLDTDTLESVGLFPNGTIHAKIR